MQLHIKMSLELYLTLLYLTLPYLCYAHYDGYGVCRQPETVQEVGIFKICYHEEAHVIFISKLLSCSDDKLSCIKSIE